jgi:hypothetical protein
MKKFEYDVALSFAEEDLNIALSIYLSLKLTKEDNSIFYYKKSLDTTGKVLKDELPEIYKHKSRFVLMLVSKNYVNKDKVYAPIEAEAIIQRWKFNPKESFLIPVLIDETPLVSVDVSLPEGIARVKWNHDPEALAKSIWELVRKNGTDANGEEQSASDAGKIPRNNSTINTDVKGGNGSVIKTSAHIGDVKYSK